ncbi:MAG: hypothetical protein F6J99_08920 [Moorea sp. SIO4G3]|uniref:hypothetical protein n=2 Tax=Moorena TaxID=1155738 RepID=UPI001314D8DD|nr:hypothetical protein [Moorena producens]NEO76346.1 hypothetical protein [Moorena sp. SIO4G3]
MTNHPMAEFDPVGGMGILPVSGILVERASCLFQFPGSNLTLAVRYGADYPKAGGRGEQ